MGGGGGGEAEGIYKVGLKAGEMGQKIGSEWALGSHLQIITIKCTIMV